MNIVQICEIQQRVFTFLKMNDVFTVQGLCSEIGVSEFKDYQKVRNDLAWYVKNGWLTKDGSAYMLVTSRNIELVTDRSKCCGKYTKTRPHWLALQPKGFTAPTVDKVDSVVKPVEPQWQTISSMDGVSLESRGRAYKVSGVEFADPMEAYREYENLVRTSLLDIRKKMLTG